ncbi:unnamed protein product [Lymnaea stagnalis]|uniref:Uncharacterized protein n=1 Tax=Lymnaea stagnalis TaxID=6523 RepID=A0AAV2I6X8_LYMST
MMNVRNSSDVLNNTMATENSTVQKVLFQTYTVTSRILSTLLSTTVPVKTTSLPSAYFETTESFNIFNDSDYSYDQLLNSSRLSPDTSGPPTNTPLTAPELALVTVNNSVAWSTRERVVHNLGSSHTDELAWLIPAVVGAVFVMVFLAFLFFYGVKAFELMVSRCCYRSFGCCKPGSNGSIGDETQALTANMAHSSTELKAYNSHSDSYYD